MRIIRPVIDENATPAQWRRHVLALAVPVMISNSTVPLVGIVDTAVMGRMGSPEWVAATAVGAVIFSSIYWVFGFLRQATGGLVAQAYGAHSSADSVASNAMESDSRRADSVVQTTFGKSNKDKRLRKDNGANIGRITVRALLLGCLFSVVLLLLQVPLLSIALATMQDDGQWQELTARYFHVRIFSAPATLLNYAILGTLIGLQKMRLVLLLQLLLNLLNVVLNVALFSYTQLDIAGVALATVISEYVTLFVGLYLLRELIVSAFKEHAIAQWLFNKADLLRYFRISRDLFIRTLCLTFAFYWMSVLSSREGVVILAANTVLLHMVHFASYSMDGFSDACESLTGFAVGRRSYRLFRRAMRAAVVLGATTALVFALSYALLGTQIIALLATDAETRNAAAHWLPWVIAAPLIGIWSFLLDGIFIGATQTAAMRNGMLISLALFLITAYYWVPQLANTGIWLSYFALLIVRSITLALALPSVVSATHGHTAS